MARELATAESHLARLYFNGKGGIKMKIPIYPGDLRIFSLNTEETVVIKWDSLERLLCLLSRERLIREFAPDKETASSWKKTLRTKFDVIEKIFERHSVK